MNLKTKLDTDRVFSLLSTREGGVELSWYDEPAPDPDDPLFVPEGHDRVTGYVTVLKDGRLCIPFTHNDDYWVCVVSGDAVFVAKTEEYPPPDESLIRVILA